MKKRLLYIAILTTVLAGCRQKGDIYLNPNDPINLSYSTYSKQFDVVWRGMNMYYAFWSEDTTDWDDVYLRMMPKFVELDTLYARTGIPADSLTMDSLYSEVTATLLDHHMVMAVRDVHTNKQYRFSPGRKEVDSRDYVSDQRYGTKVMEEQINSYITNGMLSSGQWGEMDSYKNFFGIRNLDDNRRIAYLWLNGFNICTALKKYGVSEADEQYISNCRNWLKMCLSDSLLAGIILDVRCNSGGQVRDLDLVVGGFISEPLHYTDRRYKEGPGRYEYTDWMPAYVDTNLVTNRRDLESDNIPYIVLTNAYSISMAEITAEVVKMLPTGCVIGERTFGAHGQLAEYNTLFHDGTFGDINGKHYVYTSSMQSRFVNDGVLEGIGVTPTKTVLQAEDGYEGAMIKAIDYIKAY